MKVFVIVLAFVACTSAANGVSSYQSGLTRSSNNYLGGGLGNQRQNIQQAPIVRPVLSAGNYDLTGTSVNQGQAVRRVEEPSKPSRRTIIIAQPEETGRNHGGSRKSGLGIASAPVRRVSTVQPAQVQSNVQNVRTVSYSQPISAAKPIRTVQIASSPISTPKISSAPIIAAQPVQKTGRRVIISQQPNQIPVNKQSNVRPISYSQPISTIQPIRTVQVAPQKTVSSSPTINLGGAIYGSGLGLNQNQEKSVRQGNYEINSGISNQQNVRPVSYSQPIISAQPIQTVQVAPQKTVSSSPINLGGSIYGSGLGLNQNLGQIVRRENYEINSGINKQQNVRPVSYSQPIISAQPIQTVQVAPQKTISSSPINLGGSIYGSGLGLNQNLGQINSGINKQQNVRPVSYSQPIISAQPIQTVQVAPQKLVSSSPINLGGQIYGSGLGLNQNQGQIVRRVNYDINSGIRNQQNVRPVSYSQQIISQQPIQTIQVVPQKIVSSYGSGLGINQGQIIRPVSYSQPIQNVQLVSRPQIYSQPIRTIQLAPQQIISQSPISLSGTGFGLGVGQEQAARQNYGISRQLNVGPVSFPQQIITTQPIRTVQVSSQPIISTTKINLGQANYGSGLGLNQEQPIRQISIAQPSLSAGNYGLSESGYGISQPIYTNYDSGSGINSYGNIRQQLGGFVFGKKK